MLGLNLGRSGEESSAGLTFFFMPSAHAGLRAGLSGEQLEQLKDRLVFARRALWIILIVDFVLEELLGQVAGLHPVNFLGPPDHKRLEGATLVEYRAVSFAVVLIGAWCQSNVLELVRRRSVLLRLLGARQAMLVGLNLLLMGAFAMVKQKRSLSFLRTASSTPLWCCFILWVRSYGVLLGAVTPFVWYALLIRSTWRNRIQTSRRR